MARSVVGIQARVIRFRTRPYSDEELALIDTTNSTKASDSPYEKVLAEELVDDVLASDLNHLRQLVSEIYRSFDPKPIIVKIKQDNENSALKHSFLIDNGHRSAMDDTVSELIVFCPKHSNSYKEKKQKEVQELKKAYQSASYLGNEFVKRSFFLTLERSLNEKSLNDRLRKIGFADGLELNTFLTNLYSSRSNFASEVEFHDFLRLQFNKRMQEYGQLVDNSSKEDAQPGELQSILDDDMIILCRIIGRDRHLLGAHLDYYIKWHDVSSPVYSVSNSPEDRLATRFVYGKY